LRTFETIVCALVPRFELRATLGGSLPQTPVALGPEPGGPPVVGEPNAVAAAFGVHAGMRVGEAIARCPRISLIPADPSAVADASEAMLRGLEDLGAAVEPVEPGRALFAADGLVRMHGGLARLLAAAGARLGAGGRAGAGPGRFVSHVAALQARPGRPLQVTREGAAGFLANLPVDRLGMERMVADELEALGITTAGRLAALPLPSVADRFGGPGIAAWRLARGEDERYVCPRTPPEPMREAIDFPEPVGNELTLRQALVVLVDRVLALPVRGERPVRGLVLAAHLAGGGSWRKQIALRDATSDPRRVRDALLPRLSELPGHVDRISLELAELGQQGGRQEQLLRPAEEVRRERAAEAARQVSSALGEGHLMRVVEVAPWSRIPEGRSLLVPFEG
jgi:protein ImuB